MKATKQEKQAKQAKQSAGTKDTGKSAQAERGDASTELVFVLDKSGSMAGLETDTIGGYNSMLEKQRLLPGDCRITTVLFSNQPELLHDRIDLAAISPLTAAEYSVGGSTALLDSIGFAIDKIGSVQKHTAESHRAGKVLVVIITDGEENSSRHYSLRRIKKMIEHQTETYGWEFIFLGANIDAVETAGNFGIAPTRAQNYHADARGVATNFAVMSKAVAAFREAPCGLPDDWNEEIQKDYASRKGHK